MLSRIAHTPQTAGEPGGLDAQLLCNGGQLRGVGGLREQELRSSGLSECRVKASRFWSLGGLTGASGAS